MKKLTYFQNGMFHIFLINKKDLKLIKNLRKVISSLLKKIKLPNNTFVHRDFHVSNLMLKKKGKISVIDSQDACLWKYSLRFSILN